VRTLIANGNYCRGAALPGFNHLKRLKNARPPVFENPSAIDRTVPAVMKLTERLAAIAPVKIPPIYFATMASEVNDHLIKFMGYGNDFAGEPRRRKMISRRASYRVSTIAGAALGGSNELHDSFGIPTGLSMQVGHPSWPNAALPGEDEDAFTNCLAGELEQANLDAGPGTIGAIIAEPVSVSSGMFPPPASYFTRITRDQAPG
jgi:adenosylmethionine-8-amino-7-oxononanoate aminotransferase